jgi:hypothetical protein
MERKRKSTLRRLRKIIERHGARRAPSVDAIEPEVRTDSSHPVGEVDDKDVNNRIESGYALGAYIVEWGYDVPEKRWDEFHKWLRDNEAKLAKAHPKGVFYKGTVVALFGPTHRPDGNYRTFWVLTSIDGVQSFWTHGSDVFKGLVRELLKFRDRTAGTGFSQLYQIAAGAPVY